MITCRDLFQLDLFKSIPLVAGESGLDREISWPYPKHTKIITPWVQGGEFVLVSGYELGVNEDELSQLIDEAVTNRLSGLLIEGGVNFKGLSPRILQRANEAAIPLFFASRVVSFLDICRDISSLILESQLADKYTSSLLEKVLDTDSSNRQGLQFLFETYGVSSTCFYKIFLFSILSNAGQTEKYLQNFETINLKTLHLLQTICDRELQQAGIKILARSTLDSIAYLVCGDTDEDFQPVKESMEKVRAQFSVMCDDQHITLALSGLISDITGIAEGFNQALYTNSLMARGVTGETVCSFDDLGSYQLPFYIEDKNFLRRFRDQYLKKLYDLDHERDSQLLVTLRAYLAHDGNVLRTAEALYIHRSTLQYRLSRIAAVTGQNLNDSGVQRDFQNALMLLDLYPFP